VRIIQRKFDNFSSQKNAAIAQAKYDWIFLLDADERITPSLKEEILEVLNKDQIEKVAFWIKRINFFKQKKIRFSGWQNDKVIRLFNRNFCKYNNKPVHEEIVCDKEIGQLKNPLLHYTYADYNTYKEKIFLYSRLKAEELLKKGIKPNFFHLYIKPAYRFIYHYLYKFGFLDGKSGYIISKINAKAIHFKYKILKNKNISKK
jgi:glycosyltransferase involved in cell wall biosynthesis